MRYRNLIILAALAAIIGAGLTMAGWNMFGGRTVAAPVQAEASDYWTEDRIFLAPAQAAKGAADGLLPGGAKSILRVEKKLGYGEFHWNDANVAPGKLAVRVDLRTQLVSVFKGGHEIGTAVILFGAEGHDTPLGRFPVKAKSRDHHSRTYDAPMPFSLWLTDDGVAVHGSKVKWGTGTHGCVGIPLEFAEKLFEQAGVGDVVEIVRTVNPVGDDDRT